MKLNKFIVVTTITLALTACGQVSERTGLRDHNNDYRESKLMTALKPIPKQSIELGDDYSIPDVKSTEVKQPSILPPDLIAKKEMQKQKAAAKKEAKKADTDVAKKPTPSNEPPIRA